MPRWFTENKDLLTVLVALIADIEHRIVDPEFALDAWVNLRNIKEPANRFIDERQTKPR
jgi:hypothetical protein